MGLKTSQPVQTAPPVISSAPTPFAVVPPSQSKSLKAPKKLTASQPKVPVLRGDTWFKEHVKIGDPAIVKQIRRYTSRKSGFHCAPCGIAGSNGIVIEGLPGKGEMLDLFEVDQQTKEMKVVGQVRGFLVGETCLKKYGLIDIKKIPPPAAPGLAPSGVH
jgi:hypothetical protein